MCLSRALRICLIVGLEGECVLGCHSLEKGSCLLELNEAGPHESNMVIRRLWLEYELFTRIIPVVY